jgi:hypothetical protein
MDAAWIDPEREQTIALSVRSWVSVDTRAQPISGAVMA